MAKIKEYVLGFMFDPEDANLVLIEKQRPDWARGKWNGVGGLVNPQEQIGDAMARELQEEAGAWVPPSLWRRFATMTGNKWEVHMFETQAHSLGQLVRTMTDEQIAVHEISTVRSLQLVPSLVWIIPLALDRTKTYAHIIAVPNIRS